MNKRIVIGYFERGEVDVEIELKEKEGKGPVLSITGNVWLPSKRDIIAGGQMEDRILGYLDEYVMRNGAKTIDEMKAKLARLVAIWHRWHLNDMRPGCEHQREWDTSEKLTVVDYTWGDTFHAARRRAEEGAMSADEYAAYGVMHKRVYAATIGFNTTKFPTQEIEELLAGGWLKVGKTEEKTAGWVHINEHPKGLMSKPCDVCGYKYGNAWIYEPIPADVLAEIKEWLV